MRIYFLELRYVRVLKKRTFRPKLKREILFSLIFEKLMNSQKTERSLKKKCQVCNEISKNSREYFNFKNGVPPPPT